MNSSCETMSNKNMKGKAEQQWSSEDHSYRREHYSLNSLWACWYAALTVLFQVYIVSQNVQRFTAYLSLSWPKNSPTYRELNVYVILTGLGVVIMPFFVVATMMKIGNHSNDGVKIGSKRRNRDPALEDDCIYANCEDASARRSSGQRSGTRRNLMLCLWKHALPIGGLLHAISAICFLLPRILMEAQLISHGLLPRADIWKTDMDFLLNHVEDGRVELLSFLDPINETEKRTLLESMTESPLPSQESPPVAVVSTTRRHGFAEKMDLFPGELSPELINLFIALMVITVRYPSCFWLRNKAFGFLFSIQLFVTSIISLILISCFTILYKVHVICPSRALLRYPSKFLLNTYQTVVLSLFMIFMMLISSNILYYYGHQKYTEWLNRQRRRMHHVIGSARCQLWRFLPHFLAFVCLLMTALPAIPLMNDLILVYCGSLDSASLIGAAAIAFYLLELIILWLFLTLKHSWNFSAQLDETEMEAPLIPGPQVHASLKRSASRILAKGDPPLLIIDHGQTIQVREASTKNAIRAAAQRSRTMTQKAVSSLALPAKTDETASVYWLRPQAVVPSVEKKSADENNACNEGKSTGSWLRRKRNKSDSQVKRKNSFLKSVKKQDSLEDTFSDDGDYSTMRSLVHREDTEENVTEKTFAPAADFDRQKNMNGDYELLVEQNDPPNGSFNQSSGFFEDIYGIRSLFNPVQSLRVQTARNEYLQGRLGSLSSESSNSPEKSSDTSSGVHSGSSPGTSITSEKRCASAENLMKSLSHQIHARPSFRSSSLQRQAMFPHVPIQVRCPKVNYSATAHHHPHQPDSPFTPGPEIPPPMNEINTMVIRRCKNRSATQEIHCPPSAFTRKTNMRMTSFTESSPYDDGVDDYSNHPLPPPPHHLLSPDCSSPAEKPMASITPQLPPFPSFDTPSSPVKPESTFEMEIARHFLQ